jgi:hypothetical protein
VINWQKASIHLSAFPLEMEGKTGIFYVSFFYQNIHSQSFGLEEGMRKIIITMDIRDW